MTRDTDTPGTPLTERLRDELDVLLTDAHAVPDSERDEWAARLAKVARERRERVDPDLLRKTLDRLSMEAAVGIHKDGPEGWQWVGVNYAIAQVRAILARQPDEPEEAR